MPSYNVTRFFSIVLFVILLLGQMEPVLGQPCLIADYPFFGSANDLSGNNFHGNVFGPQLTDDRFGNSNSAYLFDGVDDYISLNQNMEIVTTNEFTISVWAKRTGVGGGKDETNPLFVQRSDVTSHSLILLMATNSFEESAALLRGSNSTDFKSIESMMPSVNEWHHYVLVYNSFQIFSLYIDGVQVAATGFTPSGDFHSFIDFVLVGGHFYNGEQKAFFNGAIDEVKIFDCGLTASEIEDLYNVTNINTQFSKKKEINVFPNPAQNEVILDLTNLETGQYNIIIYDALGKEMVKRDAVSNNRVLLERNNLNPGIFFFKVEGARKPARVGKFVFSD